MSYTSSRTYSGVSDRFLRAASRSREALAYSSAASSASSQMLFLLGGLGQPTQLASCTSPTLSHSSAFLSFSFSARASAFSALSRRSSALAYSGLETSRVPLTYSRLRTSSETVCTARWMSASTQTWNTSGWPGLVPVDAHRAQ